jgi:hypothetical protein
MKRRWRNIFAAVLPAMGMCYLGLLVGLVATTFVGIFTIDRDPEAAGFFPLVVAVYSAASLIPAALLGLTLFLLARFGNRVPRPHAKSYAFLLGAVTGILVSLLSVNYIDHFLQIPDPYGDVLCLGLYAFFPAALAVLLTHRRLEPGLCPSCSYDLRAHQPGQKCPECGTLILASSKTRP